MSEAATRLATALARLRVAALRALARRSGLALAPQTAHALIIRRGLSSAAELLRLSARAPRPLRPGFCGSSFGSRFAPALPHRARPCGPQKVKANSLRRHETAR